MRDRRRKWTWAYFAERRDDRNNYVDLFQKKTLGTLKDGVSSIPPRHIVSLTRPQDLKRFEALENKLSYEDIRFYRSIARSRLRKDMALRKKLEQDKTKQQAAKPGWGAWLGWGSSTDTTQEDPVFGGTMTEEQRKQLYDVLDYDEKSAVVESLAAPRETMKARIAAKLNKGSFALKSHPHGEPVKDVISIVFDVFQANVIQRPDNLEASVSLGGFGVFDGTTKNSLYPQIVQVKDAGKSDPQLQIQVIGVEPVPTQEPFLFVKFEHNPLDERADNALTVRMRHMSIIYHKGYVEAVYKFFKPASQLESVEALLVSGQVICVDHLLILGCRMLRVKRWKVCARRRAPG